MSIKSIISNKIFNLVVNIVIFIFLFIFLQIPLLIKIICLSGLSISLIIFSLINKHVYITLISIVLLLIVVAIFFNNNNKSTNYGFKKYSNVPVIGDEKTGSYFDPFVIEIDGEYIMYFSNRNKGSIDVTKSKDGINWSSPITALEGSDSTLDTIINRAGVLYKDNKYMMWYTGQHDNYSEIGYAESTDGIHFEKTLNAPVLKPDKEYENTNVMNPHVIYDEEEQIYKMWYAAGEQYEPDVICYATSKDRINWEKYNNNPVLTKSSNIKSYDSFKVGAADVHKLDTNKYLMFYIGYTDINTARIMFATSEDGIKWKKSDKYIIEGTIFTFDQEATYKPSALYNKKEKRWYLWYNGRTKRTELIGLAYNDNYSFFE